jgi:hypothetical protein
MSSDLVNAELRAISATHAALRQQQQEEEAARQDAAPSVPNTAALALARAQEQQRQQVVPQRLGDPLEDGEQTLTIDSLPAELLRIIIGQISSLAALESFLTALPSETRASLLDCTQDYIERMVTLLWPGVVASETMRARAVWLSRLHSLLDDAYQYGGSWDVVMEGRYCISPMCQWYSGVLNLSVEYLCGSYRSHDVRRVEWLESPATHRDGMICLCYQMERSYQGDDAGKYGHWFLLRLPKRCVSAKEGILPSAVDAIEVCNPTDEFQRALREWCCPTPSRADGGGEKATPPSVRTAWGPLVTVERNERGGVALAYRGSRVWGDALWEPSWNNGYGRGNEKICQHAVAVGGVEEGGPHLLAVGSSDCDGDGREEPELDIYCIPTLMREAVDQPELELEMTAAAPSTSRLAPDAQHARGLPAVEPFFRLKSWTNGDDIPSFTESPFSTMAEYERWLALPAVERAAALQAACTSASLTGTL